VRVVLSVLVRVTTLLTGAGEHADAATTAVCVEADEVVWTSTRVVSSTLVYICSTCPLGRQSQANHQTNRTGQMSSQPLNQLHET